MDTTNDQERDLEQSGSLVFHIRRLRQWHGESGLSQTELAELAGVSERQLRLYECSRYLPLSVQFMFAVAIALQVPMERLIDPEYFENLKRDINRRRATKERTDGQTSMDLQRRRP
ncbi:MAG: helix-turn-helix transcriptional regulator [Patescibacteria group bacterium]